MQIWISSRFALVVFGQTAKHPKQPVYTVLHLGVAGVALLMSPSYAWPNACECARSRIACSGHLFAHALTIKTVDVPAITCLVLFGAQHVLQGCCDPCHMNLLTTTMMSMLGKTTSFAPESEEMCANKYGR